jgi:thiamine pyrophosphate-dependent acetolactate synthase large subunit-like protein
VTDRSPTVGEALVGLLAEHGVERVFGIPGVHTLELFRGLGEHGVAHALNRHEQGAVFAADGYARVTGRPGVALVISGPGVTNAATGIAQAHHDSIPLLVIATVTRGRDTRAGALLHDLPDQLALARTITGHAEHVADAERLPDALAAAFAAMTEGRPRPAYLELPAALLRAPAPPLSARTAAARRPRAAAGDVAAAARLLAAADRPIVLAGGGAQDAADELLQVAERLDAPVVTTLNGKGVLADEHPLALGTTLPTAAVLAELAAADAVLAVGTEFCDTDYYYAGRMPELGGAVVRVDIDAGELDRHVRPTVALHSDARLALAALAPGLERRRDVAGAERARELRARIEWWPLARTLEPVVRAVGAAIPRDAAVAVDSCQLGYAGQNMWVAHTPRSWLVPHGFATLGHALPMAIGAALGAPGRPVVAVIGDGGLQYTLAELATAAAERLPVCVLLWDNDGYGEMRDEMRAGGIEPIATAATVGDWLAVARGLGCSVAEPKTLDDVPAAVEQATAPGVGPTVVRISAAAAGR